MSRHPRRADKGIDERTSLTPKSTFHRGAQGAAGGIVVLSRVCGTGHNNNSQTNKYKHNKQRYDVLAPY